MSNVKDHSLRAALKSTKEFIESIDSAITNVGCVENPPARWDERLGMLTLSIENLNLESEIIEKLHDAVRGKNVEVWSRLAVEKLFTTALHSALGIFPPDQGNFASRLAREIQKLSNLLRGPLQNWQFIFPVLGLQIMDEPFVLGNVGFTHSNTDNLERLKNRVAEILKDSLLEEAEKIASANGFKKLAVIAAIGTRHYYLDRGFERGECYLVKKI